MELLYFLSSLRTPFLDVLFRGITLLGEELTVLAVFCVAFWCVDKRFAYRAGFAFFCSGLTVQCLKITFRVPRPWVRDTGFEPVSGAADTATGYSFPSGHSQSSASLFGTLMLSAKKRLLSVLFALVFVLVALSRLYLGVHTLPDVICGLALGLIFAVIAGFLTKNESESRRKELITSLLMLAFSLFTAVYSLILFKNGDIETKYASDCIKASGAGIAFALCWYVERVYIRFSVKTKRRAMQAIKCAVGLLGAGIIKLVFKLLPELLLLDGIEYFLLVVWCLLLFPLIIKRFFQIKETDSRLSM